MVRLSCGAGKAQRFLLTFGTYGDTVPPQWYGFNEAVTLPFVQCLFELMLLSAGPGTPPREFRASAAQNAVVFEVDESTKTIQRKQPKIEPNFAACLPKASILTCTRQHH